MSDASIRAHQLIERHRKDHGLKDDDETVLCHLVAELIEWCDANRVDFDLQVDAAREMLLDAS